MAEIASLLLSLAFVTWMHTAGIPVPYPDRPARVELKLLGFVTVFVYVRWNAILAFELQQSSKRALPKNWKSSHATRWQRPHEMACGLMCVLVSKALEAHCMRGTAVVWVAVLLALCLKGYHYFKNISFMQMNMQMHITCRCISFMLIHVYISWMFFIYRSW